MGPFQHPMDSVDSDDLDDTTEKRMIVMLFQYMDDLITWHSEATTVWKNMGQAMATYNQMHPNQQITVCDHFPELFEYLAEQLDMFLMPFEVEFGKEDQHDTIMACEVIAME